MKRHLPFLFGSPAFLWQALFFYIPLLLLVASSFVHGGSYYFQLFQPPYFKAIFATLLLAALNSFLCALIAYPVAYFLAFKAERFKYFLLFLLIVPFWTNFLLHVYAWFFVLDTHGFLNNLLTTIGLGPFPFMNSLFGIVMMMVYTYIPFMVLPLYAALDRFDTHLIQASEDLGATFLQTFFRVVFPLTIPALRTGFFLVAIPSFGDFIIPELMGGEKYYFVGNVITNFILGENTQALGAAFTVIAALALLLLLIIPVNQWMKRYE